MQTRRQAQGLGRAIGEIRGYGSYGAGTKATLYIGRTAGLSISGYREGQKVSKVAVAKTLAKHRIRQVGASAFGATAIDARGYYKGHGEPTTKVELVWTGAQKEPTRAAFVKNVKALAQDLALELAQREIIVEWDAPGKLRGRTDTATPRGAPPATQWGKFCAWVRKHSPAARRAGDSCSVKR